jgi:hypothetical protein
MTREKRMFTSFEKNNTTSDSIIFGDNSQGKVPGHGKIAITTEHSISKLLLVESLDYNLLSVSQLCDLLDHKKPININLLQMKPLLLPKKMIKIKRWAMIRGEGG